MNEMKNIAVFLTGVHSDSGQSWLEKTYKKSQGRCSKTVSVEEKADQVLSQSLTFQKEEKQKKTEKKNL